MDRASVVGQVGHAMTYDEARERIVMFADGETWEWNGQRWRLRHPSVRPSPRLHAAMAYDPIRRRTVLFGGTHAGVDLDDTWEWDGDTWVQATPAVHPNAMSDHSMAFDHVRSRVLLHGGFAGTTWTWDGVTWSQVMTPLAPVAYRSTMASDRLGQRVVMCGYGASQSFETWQWDGSSWAQQQPTHSPTAMSDEAGLCYDAARQRMVLFGADFAAGQAPATWEWDGMDWTQVALLSGPPAPREAVLAFDAVGGETIAFGGTVDAGLLPSQPYNPAETWAWNGQVWSLRSVGAAISTTSSRGLVYDSIRKRAVNLSTFDNGQTGGIGGGHWLRARMQEWDGTRWHSTAPAVQPPARNSHASCFDSARAVVVLFGGLAPASWPSSNAGFDDTWEWDGSSWSNRPTAVAPQGRFHHAMAFDSQRARTVLFGGHIPPCVAYCGNGWSVGDTWEWDGAQWLSVAATGGPGPREGHAMVFDSVRYRTVLYGGRTGSGQGLGDTWEWDGTSWTQIATYSSPPVGADHAMAWDPIRNRTVLYVGNQLWEYDGFDWTLRPLATPIPDANSGAMVFDELRGAMLVAGGATTRLLGPLVLPRASNFGSGCSGTQSAPRLAAAPPQLGEPDGYSVSLHDAPANTPIWFASSPVQSSTSFGNGCVWFLGPAAFAPMMLSNSFGHADLFLNLPVNLALRGVELHLQAAALDPSSSLGLALSDAMTLRLGG